MRDNRSLEQKIRQVVYEAQQNRNTEARKKVANVGRPEGESRLSTQGEIKTKIIDEAGPETQPKEPKDETKDKKPAKDKDTVDAKKITGGKTEVDLNPTTDDRTEDGKKIDDKAKKSTKQANREGGVQEETNMFKSDTKFGLPADLIATVKEAMGKCSKCGKNPCQCKGDPKKMEEALKGGQKKLDKNHNGKLDKQDFKMLRKEEAEQVDEVTIRSAGYGKVEVVRNGKVIKKTKDPRDAKMSIAKDFGKKKKMEEETDPGFSEAELARIEEIAKGL